MATQISNITGSAVQILDGVQDHLLARVWNGQGDKAAVDTVAGLVLDACQRLEKRVFKKYGLGSIHQGDLAIDWACRILKGPGEADGLGKYDPAKPLGKYINSVFQKRAISIRRSNTTRNKRQSAYRQSRVIASEFRASFDSGASRELMGFHQSAFDAREYREIILLAADRHVAALDPKSTGAAVAQVVRDHVAEFSAWPEYQEVAEKLGLAPRYVCTLRNSAIKGILDHVAKVINQA